MKWPHQKTLIAGSFAITLLLTSFGGILSYHNTVKMMESNAQAQKSRQVLNILTDIFATLVDAEAGRRGYLLFNEQEELIRYKRAVKNLDPKLIQLEYYTSEKNPQLQLLKQLIEQRISLGQKSLELYQKEPSNIQFQINIYRYNKQLRLKTWSTIAYIREQEEKQLEKWNQQSQEHFRTRILIEILSNILNFTILSGLFFLLYRQFLQRQKTEQLEMKLAKEKELSDLKLRFFSLVSHEFRTPLSIILGSAQLLVQSSNHTNAKRQKKNVDRIQSSARLMTQLLTDILTITRAETGKLEFNPSWVEVDSFCLNFITDLQLNQGEKVKIEFFSQGQCIRAWLDERLLYSMVSNLLSNAIKYSTGANPIQLKVVNEPDAIIFRVSDRGIGIPLEAQSNLYDPFYRADNVGVVTGTGLGLTVVKNCVDLHHGEISVVSQMAIGTTFTIKIPQQSTGQRLIDNKKQNYANSSSVE